MAKGSGERKEENKGAPPPPFSSFFHLCLLELREEEGVKESRFVRAWRREQRKAWKSEQRGAWREQRQPSISSFKR